MVPMTMDPAQAKARLEEYARVQWCVSQGPYVLQGLRTEARSYDTKKAGKAKQDVAVLEQEVGLAQANVHRKASDVARLIATVGVAGFTVEHPLNAASAHAVQRAIGEYEHWIATGSKPTPHAPSYSSAETTAEAEDSSRGPEGGTKKATSWWLTIALALLSGGASGYLSAFLGVKQTCIAGREADCKPRNGVDFVQVCSADGRGYGPCTAAADRSQPIAVPHDAGTP